MSGASAERAVGSRSGRACPALRLLVSCIVLATCLSVLAPASQADGALPPGAQSVWNFMPTTSGVGGSSRLSLARRRELAHAAIAGPRTLAPAIATAAPNGTARIEGVVTSAATSKPIAEIEVCPFQPLREPGEIEPEELECATTNANGEYALAGLAAGSYDVEFFAPLRTGLDYQTQFYKEATRLSQAKPIALANGATVTGIDAALQPGGEIAGTVTLAATNAPVSGVIVCASDEPIEAVGCAVTAPSGAYTIVGLASGAYDVLFLPLEAGETSYAPQFYDDKPSAVGSTLIDVTAGASTSGIDAALVETVPLARTSPELNGSAVAGQTLTVVHASWSNQPTSFLDHWLRCATSVSVSCLVVGTGESYALQSNDVGSVIRVKEWAFGSAGESEPVGSAPTAIVQAAPPAVVSPPAVVPPPPAPALGALASKSAFVSVAELRSLLGRLLTPSGRNAKIAQLLKHKGYSLSFSAPSAGKLTISWYLVPKGAHLAAAKPVLAARGSVSSPAAGATKLTIELTAKGRGLLLHASRLGLTAKGALAASGGSTVSATRSFTLKR
ncbi:MAG TPA: hypothetical protein VK707_00845 [Solirubrobacteraceae bacterium]|nr:hypothetical protein [Solirubrobacteraceae bacterium]